MLTRISVKPAFFFLLITGMWLMRCQAQTTVFSDDFSANQSATYTTSGAIGGSGWTVNRSGADWAARRNSSPAQLELTNDASAASNTTGWVFAYSTSSFSYPYNTALSSNTGVVTWNFNMRQSLSNPSGFNSGNDGVAFILGSTSSNVATAGNGYAVVLGNNGGTDPLRLVSFTGGIQTIGTSTTPYILASNTSGLTSFSNEYLSIRVTYTPSTNTWQMFVRNDGTSAFANPAAGTLTSQGTAINSLYIGTSLSYMGAYWQGVNNNATQTAFFDNVSVNVAGTALSASTSSIAFGNVCSNATSTNSFTFNGAGLSGNITVTAPTNFTVSTDNVTFASSVSVTPVSNAITNQTVYVKFSPTSATSYSGNVTLSGGSATTVNVAVTGTGLPLTSSNAGVDGSICSSSTFTFSTDAPANYSSLAWTTSGSGTFSPNATSLHPTYNPSGSDVSAGTVTLTLAATGTCNSASDPMVLTINPVGQWMGTVSSDWFNAGNWCSGIPTATTDVIISSGVPNMPAINASGALCRNLTLNNGASLTMNASGTLSVYGNFTINGTGSYSDAAGSSISFTGSSAQTVSTLSANSVTVNNAAGLTLSGNMTVATTLTLNNGVLSTGSYEVIVTNTSVSAVTNYSQTRYVNGKLRRSFAANGQYNFPIGTSSNYELATLDLHSIAGMANAVASFSSTINGSTPNVTVQNTMINTLLDGGMWTVTPNAQPSSGTYDITLNERGFSNHATSKKAYTVLKRTNSSFSWTSQGTTVGNSQTWANGTVKVPCYGLTTFSDFAIGFGNTVLPITLTSFAATADGNAGLLTWTTASEYRNALFNVQRSSDGLTFENLGRMLGHGTTDEANDYRFVDPAPNIVNYYRLEQVDADGNSSFSPIRALAFQPVEMTLAAYPNPFVTSTTLKLSFDKTTEAMVDLYNVAGINVARLFEGDVAAGETKSVLLDAGLLDAGVYFCKVATPDKTTVTRLVVTR